MDDFCVVDNIFNRDERNQLVQIVKNNILTNHEMQWSLKNFIEFPGNQTVANLHKISPSNKLLNKLIQKVEKKIEKNFIIEKSWGVITTNKESDFLWHTHKFCDYSLVYYLKTIPFLNDGTVFKDFGFVRVKQNSCLIFPSKYIHSAPKNKIPFTRYTIGANLIRK